MQYAVIDVVFTSSVNIVALLNLSLRSAWLTFQPHGVNKCNGKKENISGSSVSI